MNTYAAAQRSDYTESIIELIARDVRAQYPGKPISMASLDSAHWRIVHAYRSRERVRVLNLTTGEERTGVVSRTTGWKPAFLLMGRSNQRGSSDLIGVNDRVVAVQRGRKYVSVDSEVTA